MKKVNDFLNAHKLKAEYIDLSETISQFHSEMKAGLEGRESSLKMLPAYITADSKVKPNYPVVAIDAGGTNFRAAQVHFDKNLKLVTENIQHNKMPAVDREMTKEEFFDTLTQYLADYKDFSDKIGFCFSYAIEIFPNKDGKLLEWTKEVKAPGVVGQMIGKNLLEAMGTPNKQVVLMNDTVSTLLAGQAATAGKDFDTYIGFILGTGTNTSYIEKNSNITKTGGLDPDKWQIINIESGNFSKMPRTKIDIAFDKMTKTPGKYTFEKMFAGGYFGGLCTTALKQAADEGLFSDKSAKKLGEVDEFSSEEVNKFVLAIEPENCLVSKVFVDEEDKKIATLIIEALIERAAKLVAANIAAVILKTGKAKSKEKPVLMTIEGTTFYKLKDFRLTFEKYLQEILSGDNQRYYEIVEVANSSLIGAAIAAIVN